MKLYKNLSNESGIAKYEIRSNGIRVLCIFIQENQRVLNILLR